MNDYYVTAAEAALKNLKMLRSRHSHRLKELSDFDNTILKYTRVKGRRYYYSKLRGESTFTYLGTESNKTVANTKEHRFLTRMLAELDSEIANLERFRANHRELDYDSVNLSLPVVYRDCYNMPGKSAAVDTSHSSRAAAWKESKELEMASYERRHPEGLVMKAIDGTRMRSKSEVIIANLLIANGIPYVYELPHAIGDVVIHTDFTALSLADYKTEILIEHEGLMSSSKYQQQFLFKVNAYLDAGIIPGKDIFFTFEDPKGGFDPSPIQDIIDMKLKPPQ